MSEQYLGQIVMLGFDFAPVNTALCDGQLLPISQYDALYQLLGTTYGGDGVTTFALPNLQGNVPVHQGQGNGLSSYVIGQRAGDSTITVSLNQLPSHSHAFSVSTSTATNSSPSPFASVMPAQPTAPGASAYAVSQTGYPVLAPQIMNSNSLTTAGGSLPHNNMMPTLFITFAIVVVGGIYPSQS
jgi:microcystin-dependent protein